MTMPLSDITESKSGHRREYFMYDMTLMLSLLKRTTLPINREPLKKGTRPATHTNTVHTAGTVAFSLCEH